MHPILKYKTAHAVEKNIISFLIGAIKVITYILNI